MTLKPNGINDYTGITIDFETGGLDCTKCAITEIALNAFRVKDLKMVDRLCMQIYPYRKKVKRRLKKKGEEEVGEMMEYQDRALEYSNITMEELENNGIDIKEAGDRACQFIERNTFGRGYKNRPFFLGQNIQFDLGFWAQFMDYSDNTNVASKLLDGNKDYWGNFQPHYLDTIDVAKMIFGNDPNIDKYKLENVAERLGFTMFDAHDAQADTDATFNIYASATSKLRSGSGVVDDGAIYQQEKLRDSKFKI